MSEEMSPEDLAIFRDELVRDNNLWGFGPEDNYEVGDTFEWTANHGDVYCHSKAAKPYGTYRITRKLEDLFGRNWYEAELTPENPMSEEDMLEISS